MATDCGLEIIGPGSHGSKRRELKMTPESEARLMARIAEIEKELKAAEEIRDLALRQRDAHAKAAGDAQRRVVELEAENGRLLGMQVSADKMLDALMALVQSETHESLLMAQTATREYMAARRGGE